MVQVGMLFCCATERAAKSRAKRRRRDLPRRLQNAQSKADGLMPVTSRLPCCGQARPGMPTSMQSAIDISLDAILAQDCKQPSGAWLFTISKMLNVCGGDVVKNTQRVRPLREWPPPEKAAAAGKKAIPLRLVRGLKLHSMVNTALCLAQAWP